jgi:hypothetical protein
MHVEQQEKCIANKVRLELRGWNLGTLSCHEDMSKCQKNASSDLTPHFSQDNTTAGLYDSQLNIPDKCRVPSIVTAKRSRSRRQIPS